LMCPRAIWLERGTPRAVGATTDVLRAYLDAVDAADDDLDAGHVVIDRVEVLDSSRRQPTTALARNEPITVRVHGRAMQELPEPVFVVSIRGDHGPLFAANMHIDGNWPEHLAMGPFELECGFDQQALQPGRYRVELKIKQNVRTNFFEPRVMAAFDVIAAEGTLDEHAPRSTSSAGGADVPYRMMGGG